MYSDKLNLIIQNFFIGTKVLQINLVNKGHINMTYIVEHLYRGKKYKFILQRLSKIFESHEIVNMNHKLLTDHFNKKLKNNYFTIYKKRWVLPNLIICESNQTFVFQFESYSWRAMEYIDDTFSLDLLEDEKMSYQTGLGLSKFHIAFSDMQPSSISTTIKNFHNTRYYLDKYIIALKYFNFSKIDKKVNQRLNNIIYNISNHINYIEYLLTSLKKQSIERKIIHGDPKLSNFLFDKKYKFVVSLVDLDTISSGYLLTDIADCIRSICNLSGEEPENIDNVSFDINCFNYFLRGYFSINNHRKHSSFRFVLEFIYVIIFELTIRFLTDFLQSNRYFKIEYETHNLYRAEVQFRLLYSFMTKISNLSEVIDEIGISRGSDFISNVRTFI